MDWREFVSTQNTLTLATTNTDGSSHACDLFFAHEGAAFYFLSDPKTRHVQNFLREPRVSATIHGASTGWQEIRGVQIVGTASRVAETIERAQAYELYVDKSPFVRQWLASVEFLSQVHPRFGIVEVYKIAARWLRWIDNTRGFGYKEEFEL